MRKLDVAMRGAAASARRGRALAVAMALFLGACGAETTLQRGFVMPEGAIDQIPKGSSREQVLIVLGTPSTVATVDGEVFYYISQRAERQIAFMNPRVVEQRVVAVYFDRQRRVDRVADYGLQDGVLFDFVSRTTPTGGRDQNIVRNLFEGLIGGNPVDVAPGTVRGSGR